MAQKYTFFDIVHHSGIFFQIIFRQTPFSLVNNWLSVLYTFLFRCESMSFLRILRNGIPFCGRFLGRKHAIRRFFNS